MHDLPPQAVLQQRAARAISGEDLEVMGKHASSLYLNGLKSTLTEAVIDTVKHAGLSPEQVQRVIEFTNQSAYQQEFNKEGSSHKYIHFNGGPANPSEILKDLNSGGGGTVFDHNRNDFSSKPRFEKTAAYLELEKTASDPIQEAFKVGSIPLPHHNPIGDTIALREKLADARDECTFNLSSRERDYYDTLDVLYDQVKEAALDIPLGYIVCAWSSLNPQPGIVKAAFSVISPRLQKDGYMTVEQIGDSLSKTSSAVVNPNHPLVRTFADFCQSLEKCAMARAELEAVNDAYSRVLHFEKRATSALSTLAGEGGLIPKAWRGAKSLATKAAPVAAEHASDLGGALLGQGAGHAIGQGVGTLVQYSPQIAAAIGAKEFYDRGIKYGPGQIPLRYAKSHIPGTREYYAREIGLQQGAWPM